MALYRATRAGQHPDGSGAFIREGQTFVWGGKPGAWMEEVESAEAPAPPPSEPAPAAAETDEPIEQQSESAPVAESKARKRK